MMNNRLVLRIFFFLLFVIPGFPGITIFASDHSIIDSTHVLVRQPNSHFVDSYKLQKEFNYSQPPIETNFIKQLIEYLRKNFKVWNVFIDKMPWIFKVLMWVFVLFFIFIVITKTKLYNIFYSNREIEAPYYKFLSNDNEIVNYDEAIRLQVDKEQYRLAIRLLYLKLIGILRSKELIHYSKDKTNFDFLHDLTNNDLKSRFYSVTLIFNHVWYGDIEIAKDQFLMFEESFKSLYTDVDVQE